MVVLGEAGREEAVGHQARLSDSRLVSLARPLDLRIIVLVVRGVRFALVLFTDSCVECFSIGEEARQELLLGLSANEGEPRSAMNGTRSVKLQKRIQIRKLSES